MHASKRWRSTAVAAVFLLLLAACGDDGDDGGSAAPAGGGGECDEVDEVRIPVTGLPPDFVQAPTVIAVDEGYFEKYCIDAELVALESGAAMFRAMVAGEFLVSIGGTVSAVLAKAEGADVRFFAARTHLLDFQVVGGPEFDSCETMRGARIGSDGPGGLVHSVLQLYLERECGMDIDTDVEVSIGDPDSFPTQIAQGNIAATAMHVDEAIQVEHELDVDLHTLGNSWEFMPLFHYSVFTTLNERIEENRDLFVRMAAAILETNRFLSDPANEQAAHEAIVAATEADPEIISEAQEVFGSNFSVDCDQALNPEAIQYVIDSQVEVGNLDERYEAADLIDRSICDDALALVEGGD